MINHVVKSSKTRALTITSLLSVICVVMSLTPLGYIPTPAMNITIIHIPVIIAGIIEGPIVGMTVGLVFGITSLMKALTAPTPISFVFYNPLVSIMPRILIGLVAAEVFRFVKKISHNDSLGFVISAMFGTFTNTLGVLGMTYVFYAERYLAAITAAGNNPAGLSIEALLIGIVSTNMIPETIAAAIITLAVCKGLYKSMKLS